MIFPIWKRALSYFIPLLLKTYSSEISGTLELTIQNNQLVLDSETANYSYGSLHHIFQTALNEIDFKREGKDVLILGFGAGSIAEILNVERKLNLRITGIELDPTVISIYEDFFKKAKHQVNLVKEDAWTFLQKCNRNFDYIFIDVFVNLDLPGSIKSIDFLDALEKVCHHQTQVIMNTMLTEQDSFVKSFLDRFKGCSDLSRLNKDNLVLFRKPKQ